jgi:hypothetical protein
MSFQTRGGIPRIRNLTVATDGTGARPFTFEALSMHLCIRTATNPVRVYFSQADFDADENFWEISTSELLDKPIEERCVWMRGVGGPASVDLMVLHRKG